MSQLIYSKSNILRGALIYAIGDSIAAILLNEFSIYRLIGMIIIGATVYAFEIPNYFAWIDRTTKGLSGWKSTLSRTGLAIAYFNPLWIYRHLLFIRLFQGQTELWDINLLRASLLSFAVNIPISMLANYIIQNRIKFDWRFMASAIFSGIMAIYYALSEVFFL